MRSFKKFVALTACMLICVMFFTACGSSEYVGTWEATKASAAGPDGNVVEMDASDIYENFTLKLKSGGKATVNLNGEESAESAWKEVDGGIVVDDMTFKNDGGKLVIEQSGATIVFEKQ